MTNGLIKSLFTSVVKRPLALQCGALVYRYAQGELQVLVITSRETKRWIIPKGWPMDGKTLMESARIEAWEEAGLKTILNDPYECGTYTYEKRMGGPMPIPTLVRIFAFETNDLSDKYPEKGERKRKWVSAAMAKEILNTPMISKSIDAIILDIHGKA